MVNQSLIALLQVGFLKDYLFIGHCCSDFPCFHMLQVEYNSKVLACKQNKDVADEGPITL